VDVEVFFQSNQHTW